MADELLSIPINSIEADFDDFLSPNSNKRIIFSGPFGIGKTYFLNKFFKNRNPNYLPIFLRPVNYSLLSNEDVFRLIKYDILLQLINIGGFEIENEFNFSELDYANFFIGEIYLS
jgi:GTPase SAR1 family protein